MNSELSIIIIVASSGIFGELLDLVGDASNAKRQRCSNLHTIGQPT